MTPSNDRRSRAFVLSPLLGREPKLVFSPRGALVRNAFIARCDCGWAYLEGEWRTLPLVGVQAALFSDAKVEVRRCAHCHGEASRPLPRRVSWFERICRWAGTLIGRGGAS